MIRKCSSVQATVPPRPLDGSLPSVSRHTAAATSPSPLAPQESVGLSTRDGIRWKAVSDPCRALVELARDERITAKARRRSGSKEQRQRPAAEVVGPRELDLACEDERLLGVEGGALCDLRLAVTEGSLEPTCVVVVQRARSPFGRPEYAMSRIRRSVKRCYRRSAPSFRWREAGRPSVAARSGTEQ